MKTTLAASMGALMSRMFAHGGAVTKQSQALISAFSGAEAVRWRGTPTAVALQRKPQPHTVVIAERVHAHDKNGQPMYRRDKSQRVVPVHEMRGVDIRVHRAIKNAERRKAMGRFAGVFNFPKKGDA